MGSLGIALGGGNDGNWKALFLILGLVFSIVFLVLVIWYHVWRVKRKRAEKRREEERQREEKFKRKVLGSIWRVEGQKWIQVPERMW